MKIKERPILFNGEMVRAILDGRKTQTRRDAKLPLPASPHQPLRWVWSEKKSLFEPVGSVGHISGKIKWGVKPKYGNVGDRLWVRETWCQAADDYDRMKYNSEGNLDSSCCHYRADGYEVRHVDGGETKSGQPKSPWCPSIHMPRWASRITLEITEIRVERLNDISVSDIEAEGLQQDARLQSSPDFKRDFQHLWESINGPGSWSANPWVWVVEFRRLTDA